VRGSGEAMHRFIATKLNSYHIFGISTFYLACLFPKFGALFIIFPKVGEHGLLPISDNGSV
jgi:hypothetical protein